MINQNIYTATLCYIAISMASGREVLKEDVDFSPEGTILKKFVFSNATKYWNNYVRGLIHFSAEKKILERNVVKEASVSYLRLNQSVKSWFQYLFKLLKQFLNKSKQVNDCHVDPILASNELTPYELYEIILLEPLMTYRLTDQQIDRFSLYISYIPYFKFKQHLFLDPSLCLNISFDYIYFSSNSILKCYFGHLIVQSAPSSSSNPTYKYCGIVSSFTLYLTTNITIATIVQSYQISFDTMISCSVIDSNKIISYQMKRTKLVAPITVIKLFNTDFVSPVSYLFKYHLKAKRYEMLNIWCNISEYYFIKVYDGPGTLYNMLQTLVTKGEMMLYASTTFQSVIFLFTFDTKVGNSIYIYYIQYYNFKENTKEIIYAKE